MSMVFKTLCIIVTRKCNSGKCTYCNVLKYKSCFQFGEKEKKTLCDLIPSFSAVKLFGGEPLVEVDLCYEIIHYLRMVLRFEGDINLNTNLLALDNNALAWLKEYEVNLYVSLDGHIKTVKANRCLNENELKKTYKNFKNLLRYYPVKRIIVNCVLSPQAIENSPNDFLFLVNNGVKRFHFLPALYNLWKKKEIHALEISLKKIITYIAAFPSLRIENMHYSHSIPLFNDYLVWDTDRKFYPTLFVMEKFCADKLSLEIDPLRFTQKDAYAMSEKIQKMLIDSVPRDVYTSTMQVHDIFNRAIESLITINT